MVTMTTMDNIVNKTINTTYTIFRVGDLVISEISDFMEKTEKAARDKEIKAFLNRPSMRV